MTIEEIQARLYHHANLPSPSEPDGSFCFLLGRSKRGEQVDLVGPLRDVLTCLAELNIVWNGPTPSETPRDRAIIQLDRQIAYSVSMIIYDAISYALHCSSGPNLLAAESQLAVQLAFAVSFAWEAVLAGDIDDLLADVRWELEAHAPDVSRALF